MAEDRGHQDYFFKFDNSNENGVVQLIINRVNGRIFDASVAAVEFYGWSRDELRSMSIQQINVLGNDGVNEILSGFKPGRQHFEFRHRRSDGSIRDVDVYSSIINIGDTEYLNSIIFDISDRKKLELELKNREAFYKSILAASPDLIVFMDLELKISFASPGALEILGIGSIDAVIGHSVLDFVNPDQLNKANKAIKRLFGGENSGPEIFKVRKADGSFFCAEINVDFIKDSGGESTGLVFIVRDITTRKKSELQLRESERRFRTIVENAPLGIFQFNAKGVITECNDLFISIIGSSREMLIGLDMNRLPNVEIVRNLGLTLTGMNTIYEGEYTSFTAGKTTPVRVLFNPFFADRGKVEGGIGIVEDISERKMAEEALLQSELRFKSLIELAVDAILLGDPEGNIIGVNEQALRLTGYSKDELLYSSISILFSEEELKRAPFRYDLLAKGELVRTNRNLLRKDGTTLPVEMKTKIMPDRTYQSFIRDMSEWNQAREELNQALEKAKESDRLKSAFLANMSHEIRTPMNGIMGFAHLLKYSDLTGEKKDEYVDIIQKSGERMLNIINDLIDISKVEAGQAEMLLSETDVNEILDYLFDFFSPEIGRKGLTTEVRKACNNPDSVILTDNDKLLAILTNLVKNAIKFTKEGSIVFGYECYEESLQFFVKDTGPGISTDKQDSIFERFVQEDLSISKAYEGAGLGLAISRAYVELMGGKIWVESEPGKGAAFYFTVPLRRTGAAEIASEEEKKPENQIERKLKILIVEDDEASMMFISILIEGYANTLFKAENGKKALELFRENPDLDLIMMDIKLPDIDGYTLSREIRKTNREVVIIAQTAFAQAGDRELATAAGCDDYIVKPISEQVLKTKLDGFFFL